MGRNEDTQAFLEHYGVKGMQWGKRRASTSGSSDSTSKSTSESKSVEGPKGPNNTSRNLKIAGTAAVGIGALAVGAYLVKSGAVNANTLRSVSNAAQSVGSAAKTAGAATRKAPAQAAAKVERGKQFTQDLQASKQMWDKSVADLRNDIATENAKLDRRNQAQQANFDRNYPRVKPSSNIQTQMDNFNNNRPIEL